MLRRTERLADYLVYYLSRHYPGSRHVMRVGSWIGFLLSAIERLPGVENLRLSRARQVTFDYRGRHFKARYSHGIRPRGGIEFVEVLPGRGRPEGDTVLRVASLASAEVVYSELKTALDRFVESRQ
jgi:hypothetical protein